MRTRFFGAALALAMIVTGCDSVDDARRSRVTGAWTGTASPDMFIVDVAPDLRGPYTGGVEFNVDLTDVNGSVFGAGTLTWTAPSEDDVGFVLFDEYSESIRVDGLYLSTTEEVQVFLSRFDYPEWPAFGYVADFGGDIITGQVGAQRLVGLDVSTCCEIDVEPFELVLRRR